MNKLRKLGSRKKIIILVTVVFAAATLLGGGASALFGLLTQRTGYHPYDQGINRAYWTGIGGTAVSNLTSQPTYPNRPTGTNVLPKFQATDWNNPATTANWADSYGQRMYGYIVAPQTGTYYFWISSDDNSQLWLSTDSTQANKVQIAYVANWTNSLEWTKEANQASAAVNLTAGQYYYVEALQKEGGGGDNLAVGWRKPSDGAGTSPTEVIPGSSLSTRTPASTANAASGEKGLAGWWRLNGNPKDSSPYRNNLTPTNATLAADSHNVANSAYSFDGSTSYMLGSASTTANTNITVTARANVTASTKGTIIHVGAANGYALGIGSNFASTDRLLYGLYSNVRWVPTTYTLSLGWHSLAMTIDGSGTAVFYDNGTVVTTSTGTTPSTPTANVALGRSYGDEPGGQAQRTFNGSISDVRLYGRVLTQSEIQNIASSYNSQINLNSSPTNSVSGGNINTGLVGYWNFNGNAHDSTPYRNNGTVNGATLITDRKGNANSAYSFNGSNNYISLPNAAAITGNGQYTLGAWIKPNAYGNLGIIGWGNWGTTNAVNAFRLSTNGLSHYWWGNDITPVVAGLTDGNWHYVLAEFNGTTRSIYVDGQYVASDTPGAGHNAVANDVNIGRTDITEYFNGSIDEVRVYNRALSTGEVQTLLNSSN